jgi:hypothetical protein
MYINENGAPVIEPQMHKEHEEALCILDDLVLKHSALRAFVVHTLTGAWQFACGCG